MSERKISLSSAVKLVSNQYDIIASCRKILNGIFSLNVYYLVFLDLPNGIF
jgi:hypothetical protein